MSTSPTLFSSKTHWASQWYFFLCGVLLLLLGEWLLYAYLTAPNETNMMVLILGVATAFLGIGIVFGFFWYTPRIVASSKGFGLQGIGHTGAWRWSSVIAIEHGQFKKRLGMNSPCIIIHTIDQKKIVLWKKPYKNFQRFQQLLEQYVRVK